MQLINGNLAVIPSVTILGPLALLAALFPAVFGGLTLVMRRWVVLLSVASTASTVYFAHSWYRVRIRGTWWGSPTALWIVLTVIALLGVAWSWKRRRAELRADHQSAMLPPSRGEQIFLWAVSLVCLVLLLLRVRHGSLFDPPWSELLIVWIVALAGAIYVAYLRRKNRGKALPTGAPTAETMMLWVLVFACTGLGAMTLQRQRPAGSAGAKLIWAFEHAEPGAIISSPLATDDRVVVAAAHGSGFSTYGVVYCLDARTKSVRWKFDDDGQLLQVFSTPCLSDGRLYFGEGLHENRGCKFYCVEATSGRKLWRFETTSHTESSPCVANGKVFTGAGDDGLYCLDAVTGQPLWHFHEPLHIDADPVVVGTRLYVGSGVSRQHKSTEILCLDANNGKVLWRWPTNLPAWGSPVVDGGQVFFGLGNGRMDRSAESPEQRAGALLCVDAATGRQTWRVDVPDAVLARPAVDATSIYFGSRDHNCYCINRLHGALRWKADLGSPVVAAPALVAQRLYAVASGGRAFCLRPDNGHVIWTFDVAAHSHSEPQLISSPAVRIRPGGEARRIYFGAALGGSIDTTAALYCLED